MADQDKLNTMEVIMELIRWNFNGLIVPMVELNDILHTTTPCLAGALEVTENRIMVIYHRHRKHFDSPTLKVITDCNNLRAGRLLQMQKATKPFRTDKPIPVYGDSP